MEDPIRTIQTHFVQPALPLIHVLERFHIRYYVGGSVASILWGFYRRAADLDLVLRLVPTQIPALVAQLTPTHYIVAERLYEAVNQVGVCNVFPLADPLKIDLHIPRQAPFSDAAFVRAIRIRVANTSIWLPVATPEDMVLAKLDWLRRPGAAVGKQWTDVVDVLEVQGPELDWLYLREWGKRLGLDILLARAHAAAGV